MVLVQPYSAVVGARGLRAVMESVLMPVMYDLPSDRTIERVTVTMACVDGTEQPQLTHRSGEDAAGEQEAKTHTIGSPEFDSAS